MCPCRNAMTNKLPQCETSSVVITSAINVCFFVLSLSYWQKALHFLFMVWINPLKLLILTYIWGLSEFPAIVQSSPQKAQCCLQAVRGLQLVLRVTVEDLQSQYHVTPITSAFISSDSNKNTWTVWSVLYLFQSYTVETLSVGLKGNLHSWLLSGCCLILCAAVKCKDWMLCGMSVSFFLSVSCPLSVLCSVHCSEQELWFLWRGSGRSGQQGELQ